VQQRLGVGPVATGGERLDQLGVADLGIADAVEHGAAVAVEREDRPGRSQIDIVGVGGAEGMDIAAPVCGHCHQVHLKTSGWSKRLYDGTVTTRNAFPVSGRPRPSFSVFAVATTQTSP